jgi:hypothetical protein
MASRGVPPADALLHLATIGPLGQAAIVRRDGPVQQQRRKSGITDSLESPALSKNVHAVTSTRKSRGPAAQTRPAGTHHAPFGQRIYAFQLCRKAASLAETSARNIGWRSIDGEYLLAGTSRPSASAMARTWCGPAPQQMPT